MNDAPSTTENILDLDLEIAMRSADTLTELVKTDPLADHVIRCWMAPVNNALAMHPTIQVGEVPPLAYRNELYGQYRVRLIGILNGLMREDRYRVAELWSDQDENGKRTMTGYGVLDNETGQVCYQPE